jgi:hypothetical protein
MDNLSNIEFDGSARFENEGSALPNVNEGDGPTSSNVQFRDAASSRKASEPIPGLDATE